MLARTSRGFRSFCCCRCSSFIFICWCFSFCWCCIFIWFPGYLAMSLALHPGFSDLWRSPPALSSTPTTFDSLFFFIYRECYGFEWAFLPTGVFYLTLLPDIFGTFPTFLAHSWHFGTTCFYQGFTGSRQLLFWKLQGFILILKTQTRPVCLIHSNPQSFIHLSFVFMLINIAEVLLMVKTLIRSAATLFISHENIKQQPN